MEEGPLGGASGVCVDTCIILVSHSYHTRCQRALLQILLTLPAAAAATATAAAEARSSFVNRMCPPVKQQQQRAGQHTLIARVNTKSPTKYLVSRNPTKHAQLILELVSYLYHTRYLVSMNQRFYKPYCPCLLLLLLQMPPTRDESCRVRYQYGSAQAAAAAAKCGSTHDCRAKLLSGRR